MPYTPYNKSGASGYVPFKKRTVGVAKDPARLTPLSEEAEAAKREAGRLGSFKKIALDTAIGTGESITNFARDVVKGAAELTLSGVETTPRVVFPERFSTPREYKIPGLSEFTGPLKSFQTQAEESIQAGGSTEGAIGKAALDIAVNEPLGVAFKPVFIGLGISAKLIAPTLKQLAETKTVSGVIDILKKRFPRLGDKAEVIAPKIAEETNPDVIGQTIADATPKGGIAGNTGLKTVGLGKTDAQITRTESSLLKKRVQDEARGARVGYRAGYQEARADMVTKLSNKLESLRDARNQVSDLVRTQLPPAERSAFLKTIANIKTQRELIEAFVKVDARVQKYQLKTAVQTLKETVIKLQDSQLVSADYRKKVADTIQQYELDGHRSSTIARLEATQEYLKRMEAEGREVSMPRRVLERLAILAKTPREELSLPLVERLQEEIDLLGKLGQTKWRTKEALYEGEKLARKEELLNTATPINVKSPAGQPVGSEPRKWIDRYFKFRKYKAQTRAGLRPMDGFAEITGTTPMKRTLDADFGAYLDRAVPGVDNFRQLEADMLEAGQKISEGSRQRVGVYGVRKQDGGYEKLANLGITREEADKIVLTPEENTFYENIQKFNESTYGAVRKYMQDVYNTDVGKVENYMSYQTDFEAMSDLEAYQRFGKIADESVEFRRKNTDTGFTKERTGSGNQKVQIDALTVAQRHADDVAYMLTMGRDIKQYSEIVVSPEMIDKLGSVGALGWQQYLDLLARKGGAKNASRIGLLDQIRKNVGVGVLAGRLSTILVQLTSFADTAGTIGIDYATDGAAKIATSKEWRDFIMNNFPEIRAAVGDDIAFREFGSGFLDQVSKLGMKPIVALDGVMRSSAAAGSYIKLAKERGIPIDLTKPDKDLIVDATKLMRDSQGSSFFKDQPLALTVGSGLFDNKSFNKMLLQFQSFMLNRWENIERQIWRAGIKEGDYAKAGMSAFWLLAFAAMAEEGIRTGVRGITSAITGKEQTEQDFLANSALNVVEGVPLLGSIVSSISYSSNPVPVISAFNDAVDGISSVITGKKDTTKARGAVRAAGAIGSLLGVPGSTQAAQLIKDAIPTSKKKTSTF